jgi:hypothetical protein
MTWARAFREAYGFVLPERNRVGPRTAIVAVLLWVIIGLIVRESYVWIRWLAS